MLLRPRRSFLIDPRLALSAAQVLNFPAQTMRVPLPRVAPYAIEDIFVVVTLQMKAAIAATIKNYGLLGILKRFQLGNIPNQDGKPSNIVDMSGPALLMLVSQEGLNLDGATQSAIFAQNLGQTTAGIAINSVYRITYRIPCVHPFMTDTLRPRCLLPIWTFNQDPIITMDFAGASEMCAVADPFTSVGVEVFFNTREMPSSVISAINANGGFMSWDLLETVTNPASSLTNVQVKALIPTPGSYMNLLIHMIAGGATPVPQDLSATTGLGTALGTALSSANVAAGIAENEWQLRGAGKDIIESWRMKYLQILNDQSRAQFGPSVSAQQIAAYAAATVNNGAVSSARFAGPYATGLGVQDPSSVFLDFASDGVTDVSELGSLFNTKAYADRGLEVAVIGNVTTPAAGAFPNVLSVSGRRIFGDLTQFTTLKGLL